MNLKTITLSAVALWGAAAAVSSVAETTLTNGVYNPEAIRHFQEYRQALEQGRPQDVKEFGGLTDVKARPERVLRRSAYAPQGHVYGVIPRHRAGNYAYYGSIDLTDGRITPVYTGDVFSNGEDYDSQTGAVRDGILYIPQFLQNMVTSEIEIRWKRFNVETGEELTPISFGGQTFAYLYCMTYDKANDRFVGLAMDLVSGGMGKLVIIDCKGDPSKWIVLENGNIGGSANNFMAALAYNPADQNIYGLKDNGRLYLVDVDWADCTVVKEFDYDNEWFMYPEYPFSMPLVYSPRDRAMVTVYRDNYNERMLLGYIDMDSYDAVLGEELNPVSYVTNLVCGDAYAPDEAPDMPVVADVTFVGPALNGTFTLIAPKVTFAGETLTSDVHMVVTLNGDKAFEADFAPGEQREIPLELTEGFYALEAVAMSKTDDTLVSPAAKTNFFVGYDNPVTPTGLQVNEYNLSWNAAGAPGAHGGYVDPSHVTYNVLMDGVVVNEAPVKGTSFALPEPETMARRVLQVVALADDRSSEPSAGYEMVLGRPLALPVMLEPDADQAKCFTTYNANHDSNEFKYQNYEGKPTFRIATGYYYEMPDDWLFLPIAHFDRADVQYALDMEYLGAYTGLARDNMDIWIGSAPSPESMYGLVYSHTDREISAPTPLSARFVVPAAGDYVIGIHSKGGETGQYRGVALREFSLHAVEGSSVKTPGEGAVTAEAAPGGELKAVVNITAAVEALDHSALTSPVTYTATCGDAKGTVVIQPGQTGKVEVAVPGNGFHEIFVTPSNDAGEGIPRMVRVYVGLDKPEMPENITGAASADNLSLELTWETPTEGANGGYVDPDGLIYEVYLWGSAGNHTLLDRTTDLHYTYNFGARKQERPSIGVCAVNSEGKSNVGFASDFLGTPNELPMVENFNYTSFAYSWRGESYNEYSDSMWDSVSDLNGMGIGDPVFNEGGLMCTNLGGGECAGKLLATKFSTVSCPAVVFTLRYWDFQQAASIEVWARSEGNREEYKIAEVTPSRGTPHWEDWNVTLPAELLEQKWVQLNIRVDLSHGRQIYIDTYAVNVNIEHDFKIASMEAPYMTFVGETPRFKAIVTNVGKIANGTDLLLELVGDDKVLESQEVAIRRTQAGASYECEFSFEMKAEYSGSAMSVRATIMDDQDQIASNNVRTTSFLLQDNVIPVVHDLKGEWTDEDHRTVTLNWSAPEATYGGFESFESIPSFQNTGTIADWLNIDMDGKEQFTIQNASWAGSDKPSAWTVFNAEEAGTMNEERLSPHSGTQMLIARAIAYTEGVDQPEQNHDWLISPEVVGGTKVTFWMNIISSTYPETVAIYYSTTDREVTSFKKGRNFTKSGGELWEENTWTLPADARYFALVYESWGTFAAMIDDITYTPADKSSWDLKSYDIWREAAGKYICVAEGLTSTSWIDEAPVDNATYYVVVKADRGEGEYESPRSNPAKVDGDSGIDSIAEGGVIGSGRGFIFVGGYEGQPVSVYSLDGRKVAAVSAAADREEIRVAPGVYTVSAGATRVKVLVK